MKLTQEQLNWLNGSHIISEKTHVKNIDGGWFLDDFGKITVNGSVRIPPKTTKIPVEFSEVSDWFSCLGCRNLESLKGSPRKCKVFQMPTSIGSLDYLPVAKIYVKSQCDPKWSTWSNNDLRDFAADSQIKLQEKEGVERAMRAFLKKQEQELFSDIESTLCFSNAKVLLSNFLWSEDSDLDFSEYLDLEYGVDGKVSGEVEDKIFLKRLIFVEVKKYLSSL